MHYQSAAQLWFKPSGLGRHNVTAVGYVHNLLHTNGIQGKRHLHFATVHSAAQFVQAAQSAHKVNTLARAQVLYVQDVVQDKLAADTYSSIYPRNNNRQRGRRIT